MIIAGVADGLVPQPYARQYESSDPSGTGGSCNARSLPFVAAGLYLAMELVSGGTLADLVAEVVSVPVPWVAAIGAQLCAAVDDAPHDPARLHSMAFGAIMAV